MRVLLPLFQSGVAAGFPSPADDYLEKTLDLNEFLVHHPAATFLARAQGDSMKDSGIHNGDILIVDRSLQPRHHDIVVAALHGELTCKRLDLHRRLLLPSNPLFRPIPIPEEADMLIEGVVSASIRLHRL